MSIPPSTPPPSPPSCSTASRRASHPSTPPATRSRQQTHQQDPFTPEHSLHSSSTTSSTTSPISNSTLTSTPSSHPISIQETLPLTAHAPFPKPKIHYEPRERRFKIKSQSSEDPQQAEEEQRVIPTRPPPLCAQVPTVPKCLQCTLHNHPCSLTSLRRPVADPKTQNPSNPSPNHKFNTQPISIPIPTTSPSSSSTSTPISLISSIKRDPQKDLCTTCIRTGEDFCIQIEKDHGTLNGWRALGDRAGWKTLMELGKWTAMPGGVHQRVLWGRIRELFEEDGQVWRFAPKG